MARELVDWHGGVNRDRDSVVLRLRCEIVKSEPGSFEYEKKKKRKRLTEDEREEAQYRLDMNLAHDASYTDHKRHRADVERTELESVERGDFFVVLARYDNSLVERIFESLPVVADALLQDVECRTHLYHLLQLKQRSIKWYGAVATDYCMDLWARFATPDSLDSVKKFLNEEREQLSDSMYSMPTNGWLPDLFRKYMKKDDAWDSEELELVSTGVD